MAVLLYLIAAGYIRYITHIGERNDSGIFLFLLQVSKVRDLDSELVPVEALATSLYTYLAPLVLAAVSL